MKVLKFIKKLLDLLSTKEIKLTIILLISSIVVSIVDVLGVASIMPFISVVANRKIIYNNKLLFEIFENASNQFMITEYEFLFALGVFFFLVLILSLTLKGFLTFYLLRYTFFRDLSIGKRLVKGYLRQPYSWILGRNSADIGSNILSEVGLIINHIFTPLITIISNGTTTIAIILLLLYVDAGLSISICLIFLIIYSITFKILKSHLLRIGRNRVSSNQERFLTVNEAFNAIKEIKILGLEKLYVKRFSDAAVRFAKNQSKAQLIAQIPRYILEGIIFGGMLLLILFLIKKYNNIDAVLPLIALYAFAGYRLVPALQNIYGALTLIQSSLPALDALHKDIMSLNPNEIPDPQGKIYLHHLIRLSNITFKYPNSDSYALKNLNLNIPAFTRVGIVGATGSGKTTTVDLILGLLEPQKGEFKIDDELITYRNKRMWQRNIGYVPQQIYLKDDSIAANIAFGLDANEIDVKALERASKIADLHEFVMNNLPEQYQTKVGERGVRISGGQRQRIGIARALYHAPQVLILDEATSALDNITEQNVMDALKNLQKNTTIILIAHRLNTVKTCDIIFFLENGRLVDQGKFDELAAKNINFRKMVELL